MKIILVFVLSILSAFFQQYNHINNIPQRVTYLSKVIDTSRYAILNYDKKFENLYGFNKEVQPATLSNAEIEQIEELINKRISKYNSRYSSIRTLWKYYKQLVAVTNSNGEKEVWINCFCSIGDRLYWRKEIVFVLDGSICYFNIKVNLNTNVAYDLMVNGNG